MANTRRFQIIIGLLLTIGVGLLPLGAWGRAHSGLGKLLGNEIFWWLAVVVILLYVAFVERRPFASIGLARPGVLDIVIAMVAGVLLFAGIPITYFVVFPLLHLKMNVAEMRTLIQTPFWYRLILVTRAAVAEELLFRGYPIERLVELTGSRLLAAVVSVAAFTWAHLSSWGAAQLIVAGYGGVILVGLYLWRRNLWANMLAHWIADGAGFLLFHK
ncbi:MAG TPA: type II CAAX endopeptidase family protein [Rhizomicrobium sp.]|jgi:membrane protease YdiL (CAAX protease family)|nr:type II CAAX endopeptidase family protein [Rhizomicrobium sp.]